MGIEFKRKPTTEEIEEICSAAEEAARQLILSKVGLKRVEDLDVMVEAEGDKPLRLNVEVAVEPTSSMPNLEALVEEATKTAFSAAEAKVRELDLCVDTPD